MAEKCICTNCGYEWERGLSGRHSCSDGFRTILEKYIEHVSQCEGVDFIDRCHSYASDVHFNEVQLSILNQLN